MSDSLASSSTLEATPQDGQSQRASEQPQGETSGQPPQDGQVVKVEDFKNLQRKLTEKDVESKRALTEAQQARAFAQQLQQRLQALEDNAAPDDYARLELRAKRAEEAAQYYAKAHQDAIAAQQADLEKQKVLRELAEELEVSVDDLKDATDWKSAAKLAAQAKLKAERKREQQDEDKRERNLPDLGSGAPRTTQSEWDRQWSEAQAKGDSAAMMSLIDKQPKGAKR
jgi:hypothetical protein